MPQAIDLKKALPPATPKAGRSARTAEPSTRFKDEIEQRTRRSDDAQAVKSASTEKPEKAEKPATKKSEKDVPTDEERPVEESGEAKKPKATEAKSVDTTAEEATEADTDEEPLDADGQQKQPDEKPDDAVVAIAALAAQSPTAPAQIDSVDLSAEALKAANVGSVATGKPAVAEPVLPPSTLGVQTAETSSADGESSTESGTAGRFQLPQALADVEADAEEPTGALADDLSPLARLTRETATLPTIADDGVDAMTPMPTTEAKATTTQTAPLTQPAVKVPVTPEQQFIDNNGEKIVTTIRGELMPTGGNMKIRLEPPNMGQLQIDVSVARDGTISAAFQTANEDTAKLLSHSMQHLKTAIETTGVAVDRIQVRQASPGEQSNSSSQQNDRDQQQQNPQDHPARQEQQRREMLQRMWAKLSGVSDDLDLVA